MQSIYSKMIRESRPKKKSLKSRKKCATMRATQRRARTLTVEHTESPDTPHEPPRAHSHALADLAADIIRAGLANGTLYLDAQNVVRVTRGKA